MEGVGVVGEELTATPTPSGATVDYQWMIADTKDGEYENISEATEKTYTLTETYVGKWIKVKATGTGNYKGTVESKPVGPVEEAEEEPEVVEGTWNATGNTGFNTVEGTAYVFQEFELLVDGERISLHKDNVKSITSNGKELTPNTDETLWFNVLADAGEREFVVVDNDDVTYKATLSWTAPTEVTATAEGDPAYNSDRGATYQKYNVADISLTEFAAMYQIKPVSGNISELKPSGDNCLWFKVDADEESWAQEEGDHIFLVKHGETWSQFTVNYKAEEEPVVLEATWNDTGKVGTNTIDGKAYVFQGFELLDADTRIDLVADNIAEMTVLEPGATEPKALTIGDDSDPYLWFNVQKAAGDYKYTVITKEGVTYVATLNWTAPASVEATKTGDPAYNAERGETYQLYTVEVDVTPADSKVYQIKPDGTIGELTVLADADNQLNIWFRLSGGVGPQQEGDHVFLIKKGETWSKAVINYKITEDSQAATALDAVNAYLTADKYVYVEAPGKLEEHLATLGLQVGEGSDYAALDKTADGGKNRKTAVFYDLNNNKPSAGYDLATLTTYFNDMVATRLVTEESMDLVNNAENIDALNGISFVTMLLERFQTVSYGTHSDIPVADKIATLQGLVNRYNGLDADGQAAVLAKIIEKRPTDGYARSQATTDALKTALDEITFLTMSADDVTATIGVEFTMPVTTQGTVADADKENLVRFYGVITGLAASDITFESITGGSPAVVEGDERNNAGAGDGDLVLAWGPADGFPLGGTDEQPLDYANGVTTNFKATINKTGDYTVTFVFYDITGGKQLNAEGEKVTITVTDSEN